jgi:hypothetical protein
MRRPPTDLEILEEIYRRYYPVFVDPRRLEKNPHGKIHVPIDLAAIAAHFGTDLDIIFGRLYYHLNAKHSFDQDGSRVDLFCLQVGGERHCIQFPLLASLAADLRDQRNQYLWTLWLSIIATVLSVLALGVSILDMG